MEYLKTFNFVQIKDLVLIELLELDWNTWNHSTVFKQIIIIKQNN